jgi:cytochrome c-type biogenesis protein CcmH
MIFWLIAIAVTAIACVALFYAAGPRLVNAAAPELDDANSHFRLVLSGIDADVAAGKLGEGDAEAARGELAREILRHNAEATRTRRARGELGRVPLLGGLAATAVLALALYAMLGHPEMPSQPLADRPEAAAQSVDLESAISSIEKALAANPDDLRGWTVIAPAYLELGRYDDATRAYRRIIALGGATPDLQTRLAQSLLFATPDAGSPEAMDLLRAAAASDPLHVRSRLYLAAELTRRGDYTAAIPAWNDVLALSKGDESWLPAAQQGLAVAQNDGVDPGQGAVPTSGPDAEMIGQMVSGLAARLAENGGSVAEWTQLVRAYLVLGDTAKAQAAFDSAVTAYPQAFDRGDLDSLALGAGLTIKGATP